MVFYPSLVGSSLAWTFQSDLDNLSSAANEKGQVTCLKCGHLCQGGFAMFKHMASHFVKDAARREKFNERIAPHILKTSAADISCLICKKLLKKIFNRDLAVHFLTKHPSVLD